MKSEEMNVQPRKKRTRRMANSAIALAVAVAAAVAVPATSAESANAGGRAPTVSALTVDGRADHIIGMDDQTPAFGWQSSAGGQTAYEVRVASTEARLSDPDLWSSGKIDSSRSLDVEYAGKPFATGQRVYWQVRVWDHDGKVSPWSDPTSFEMGLLNPSDWDGAKWIQQPGQADNAPLPIFARAFDLNTSKPVSGARLYLAGLGIHVATLNGEAVTDNVLEPGLSNPFQSVQYSTYDVTDLLRGGANTVGVQLGNGPNNNTVGTLAGRYTKYRNTAPQISTRLTSDAEAGDTSLEVSSVSDVVAGNALLVGTGADVEQTTVTNVGTGELTVSPPLARAHDNSSVITSYFALMAPADAGATTIKVSSIGRPASQQGGDLQVGGTIHVGTDTDIESRTITAVGTAGADGTGVSFSPALERAHQLGTPFTFADTPQDNLQANRALTPRLIAKLEVTYADGSTETIVSDKDWRSALGPTTHDTWYSGSDFDARRVQPGWDEPGADLTPSATRLNGESMGWSPVWLAPAPALGTKLTWGKQAPVKIVDTFKPVKVTNPAPGVWLFDMGQAFAGFIQLNLEPSEGSVPAGTQIKMQPAEMMHASGNGRANPSSTGSSTGIYDLYTASGDPSGETWRPQFQYHGFQYVEVTGLPPGYTPTSDTIIGLQTSNETAARPAQSIDTSSVLVNRIQNMSKYSIMSNMLSIFTDCPNREKLGWLADFIQSMPAIHREFDVAPVMRQMHQALVEQQPQTGPLAGFVSTYAPKYTGQTSGRFDDEINWQNAIVLGPYYLYKIYGDLGTARDTWSNLELWMDWIRENKVQSGANAYLVNGALGDWAANQGGTSTLLTGTYGYFVSADAMAKLAEALGYDEDAATYRTLAENIKNAFNQRFFNTSLGYYTTAGNGGTATTQASQALPLDAGMVPAGAEQSVLQNLVDQIYAYQPNGGGPHTGGGTISLGPIVRALSTHGRDDVVWDMLNEPTAPSYANFITDSVIHPGGATTIPEYWNFSQSQNHMILLQGDEWFGGSLAGIQQADDSVGFRELVIKPKLVGSDAYPLDRVSGSYRTPYGNVVSRWERTADEDVRLHVEVPGNSTAEIWVPTQGDHAVSTPAGASFDRIDGDYAVYQVGSGSYTFVALGESWADLTDSLSELAEAGAMPERVHAALQQHVDVALDTATDGRPAAAAGRLQALIRVADRQVNGEGNEAEKARLLTIATSLMEELQRTPS
jgi:alpha-L-rhamnosidase